MKCNLAAWICVFAILFAQPGKAADGTWTNQAGGNWSASTNWSGNFVASGPGTTAFFLADWTSALLINLDTDVTVGQVHYRDNGNVNRDMYLSSTSNGRLILSTTSGAPLLWAKNRSLFVDVVIAGTNGLNVQSDGSGAGVVIRKRNSYTGLTTVLDTGGTCTVAAPGDFGDSDVLVRGNLSDAAVELSLQHGQAIKPTAQLTIETGGTVQLNFANLLPGGADPGDLYITRLQLGALTLTNGIYSAATHPQFFTGTGEIVVQTPRTNFPLTLRAVGAQAAELSWPSYYGRIYDVQETTNLTSGNWTSLTVTSTPPLNVLNLATTNRPAAFYKAAERIDYLPAVRAGVIARLDGLITNNYFNDQNLNPATNRFGQFHNSDNMRMAECTPVLVWAYLQPDSGLYQNTNALYRAILSVDYMCRAQGSNGGFNENQGWCGVPNRTAGKSSVTGFTLDALGSAIRLMAGLPEMQPRLQEFMDPNGTGTNDTRRFTAWTNLLAKAMPYQFSGSGRGHAPNQDLCALEAVYAINDAYAALTGGTLLKTPAQIAVLANEIFHGQPSAASARPDGKWFSSTGLLGEFGHLYYGYDGNYGAKVTMNYLGLLARHDAIAAAFLTTKYAEAIQYFFVPDNAAPLGVFCENAISRRSTGDPLDPTILPFGLTQAYHPAMARFYQLTLPYFAAAPIANINFSSPSHLQVGVWHYCRWIDALAQPQEVSYRVPAERPEAWQFQDVTMKTLVTKPAGGVPTFYVEIWDATNQAQRHVWGQAPETIPSLGLFP